MSSERTSGEPAGLGGEPARVRVRADPHRLERARPRDDDAAREDLVAGGLRDRVGLAGEQRLVDLEPVGFSCPTVGRDLVAGAQREEIVDHDRFDRDLGALAVAHDARLGCVEDREPVERPLRPVLLHDADERVRDQHDAEQRVLDRPDDQDHDEHRAEDRVEPREDVGAGDLGQRAARALVGHVDLATRDPFGDLGRGQPFGPGRLAGVRRRGQLGRGRGHVENANP